MVQGCASHRGQIVLTGEQGRAIFREALAEWMNYGGSARFVCTPHGRSGYFRDPGRPDHRTRLAGVIIAPASPHARC